MPPIVCPVCKSNEKPKVLARATLGGDSEFDLVECEECTTRYLSPLPSVEELEQVYSSQYYGSDWYKQQGWGAAFARLTLSKRSPGRFLDLGCGLGYFIDGIRKHSQWEVYGVEFGEAAVEYAQKKLGLDVRQGNLSDLNFADDYFDYIQIRNVLEHVTDPMDVMRECHRILKPGGTLHLFVPNGVVDSLDLINFYQSEKQPGFSKSGHVFFFSKQALLRIFADTGFTLDRARTYGIRRGLGSLGIWPRIKDWKKHYRPKAKAEAGNENQISLPPRKNRPDLYYSYRLVRMNARMLPGMREFGLDYELLLTAKK